MSICPENDIHSVYLDGELNSPYKEQYLEHLQNCASCTEKLNKLKLVQGILREDSKNISLSDEQLAESYQKLSTLLKFRDVTKKSTNSPLVFLNKVIPAMAAALIIAVVLPIRLISGGISQQDLSFVSQNTNIPKLFTERGIIADDAIAKNATSQLLVSDTNKNVLNFENIFMPNIEQKSNNIKFVVNTLPYKNSTSSFNMYNNGQSLYNVTYTPMAGFEY
ncbi:MAG: zf-HC2 domain-containing protein [Spirochaetaceae bacterium]|nr:zf-HC2 domain-containing protein [Spirochaetaceae bacterium]